MDLRAVVAIEKASFGADAWPREIFVQMLEECPELFFIGRAGLRTRGYIATCAVRRGAEVVSIAVDPRCRGMGVATAMMRHTIAALRRFDIQRCWLTVRVTNSAAIRFYLGAGFRRVRRVKHYYGPGKDGWRMRLEL